MLRRLLASALVMGSAIALFAPAAKAQSVNMPFSGTVSGNCSFGTPSPGVLALSGSSTLRSDSANGTPSTVVYLCTAPVNLTYSAPIPTGTQSFTPINCSTIVLVAGAINSPPYNSCDGTSPPMAIPASSNFPVTVNMVVNSGSSILPGTYAYNVTLTLTP